MLQFDTLKIENFLSHKSTEIEFSTPELTLIVGENFDSEISSSNGAGKSAIFEALFWALFDRTTKGLRGNEVLNKDTEACSVELSFRLGGSSYIVRRSRDKQKRDLFVSKGNQQVLNWEFPLSAELFLNAIYFPQNRLENFSSASDSYRKNVLMEILQIQRFSQYHQKAKELSQKFTEIFLKYSSKIKALQEYKTNLEGQIDDAEKKFLDSITNHQQEYEESLRKNRAEHLSLTDKKISLEQTITVLERDIKRLRRDQIQDRFSTFQNSVKALERDVNTRKSQLGRLKSRCYVCNQEISSDLRDKLLGDLALDDLKEKKQNLRTFEKAIAVLESRYFEMVENKDKAESEYQKAVSEIDGLDKERQLLQDSFEKLKASLDGSRDVVNSLRSELEKVESKIESYTIKLKKAESVSKNINFWLRGFSAKGIPSFMMDQSLPFLNDKIQFYNGFLSPQFSLSFDTRKEMKSGKVDEIFTLYIDGDDRRYYSLSGGERRRIDLAILFTLSSYLRQFMPMNLLFLDEIFAGIDAEGCEGLLRLLEAEKQDNKNSVFVISHLEGIKDAAIWDKVITVQKQGGISNIVEG